jgi:hypothetical protein
MENAPHTRWIVTAHYFDGVTTCESVPLTRVDADEHADEMIGREDIERVAITPVR